MKWGTTAFNENPYPAYEQLRENGYVVKVSTLDAPVVLGYYECKTLLTLGHAPKSGAGVFPALPDTLQSMTRDLLDAAETPFDFMTQVAFPLAKTFPVSSKIAYILPQILGRGMLSLLNHPKQSALLRANPMLLPQALEEMLRFNPPCEMKRITLTGNTDVGAFRFKAGDMVYLCIACANRDPRVYPNADVFNINRRAAHLSWVPALARSAALIIFGTLLDQLTAMRYSGGAVYEVIDGTRQLVNLPLNLRG